MKYYFTAGILILLFFSWFACGEVKREVSVQVTNGLDAARTNETIVLKSKQLKDYFENNDLPYILVLDKARMDTVVSQLVDYNQDSTYEELIFQADFAPGETKTFLLRQMVKKPEVRFRSRVFARFVPERKDDFAWENDRIAFRMYGPALETENSGSGVDVWVKRTRELVINKWYKMEDYHVDHGEGLDAYKVGASRGCGGLALWESGAMVPSKNFTKWHLLSNGPVRAAFQLDYGPWEGKLGRIVEFKRVILDAGSNLNRFESIFLSDDYNDFEVAIGIVKNKDGSMRMEPGQGWLRYWAPLDGDNGMVGCGIIIAPNRIKQMLETDDHYLVIARASTSEQFVYYAGACWSKSGDFNSVADWDAYLQQFARKLASPLKIKITNN